MIITSHPLTTYKCQICKLLLKFLIIKFSTFNFTITINIIFQNCFCLTPISLLLCEIKQMSIQEAVNLTCDWTVGTAKVCNYFLIVYNYVCVEGSDVCIASSCCCTEYYLGSFCENQIINIKLLYVGSTLTDIVTYL